MRATLPRLLPFAVLAIPRAAFGGAPAVVAVMDIESPSPLPFGAAELQSFSDVLRTLVGEARFFSVVAPGQMRAAIEAKQRESYEQCHDESCQIALGKELAASKLLTAKFVRVGERCQLLLSLIDLARATAEASSSSADTPCTADGLGDVLQPTLYKLLRASGAPGGRLVITTDPPADIQIDRHREGRAPLTVDTLTGPHEVIAELTGYARAEGRYGVSAGKDTKVELDLVSLTVAPKKPFPVFETVLGVLGAGAVGSGIALGQGAIASAKQGQVDGVLTRAKAADGLVIGGGIAVLYALIFIVAE